MKLKITKNLSQWKKMYQLYKAAFPENERKPFLLIWYMHKKGNTDVWWLEDHNEFIGLAITLNTKDLVLLDYFAISEEKRGNGLGAKAMKTLQEHYKGRRLFLEIESTFAKADNFSERKRRKHFYLANGMTEMKVLSNTFGVDMELLGYDCAVDFKDYQSVYLANYGKRAAEHLIEKTDPD